MDRGALKATVYRVVRVGHDLATKPPTKPYFFEDGRLTVGTCWHASNSNDTMPGAEVLITSLCLVQGNTPAIFSPLTPLLPNGSPRLQQQFIGEPRACGCGLGPSPVRLG